MMNIYPNKVVAAALFFLVIFIFGYWLRRNGKPYNSLLLNIHKLLALAAAVFFVRELYLINQVASLSTFALSAGGVTTLLFLVGIISGGLASIDKPLPAIFLKIHRVSPYLTVLSTTLTIYLLL